MSYPRLHVVALAAACAVPVPGQGAWMRVPDFPNTPGAFASGFQPGNHRMLWDPWQQRVVLVNGFGDVWEWDGSWANLHVAGFTPSLISIAYDTVRRRIVLYSEGTTWEWDGTTWTQRFPRTTPPFRRGERIVYDAARNRVVLFGGQDALGTPLGDTWEWDGVTWVQKLPATAPSARFDHALAYDAARNRVVLFGGTTSSSVTLGDTWAWDGSAWAQLFSKPSPSRRSGHDMAYDAARQRVVLFGGRFATDTWEWDGSRWMLRGSATGPPASSAPALAYDHVRQRVLLWYGVGETWQWDGNAWTLTSAAPVSRAPAGHAVAYDARSERCLLVESNEHWEWDGTRWSRRFPATLPAPGTRHAMAYDSARQRVVLYGGMQVTATTWEWDGTNWTSATATATTSRYDHAMTYDASRRRVVLFGGFIATHAQPMLWSRETWEYDGTVWQQRTSATSTAPSPRGQTAIAYDAARQRTVLFGGAATSAPAGTGLGDTWEWDGTTWTRRTPANAPPPRRNHTMAYDSLRGRVVLFGGSHLGMQRSDTWEWDGSDWALLSASIGTAWPAGSDRPAAAYDAARQRLVMFDGISTWQYVESPAAYAPFGAGCPGAAGVPLLRAAPGSLPWAESSFSVQLAPIVAGQPAVLFFGVSSTSWSGIPLPLALGVLGRPDCSVLASLDLAVPLASATGAAALTIPLAPSLVGGVFYNQGASLDLTSGAAGLAFSNGARAEVGAR